MLGSMFAVCISALTISIGSAGLSQAQVAVEALVSLENQYQVSIYREQMIRDRAEIGNANANTSWRFC